MRHAAVADTVWMDAFEKELDLAFAAHKRGDQAGAEALCRQWLQAGRIDTRLHYLLGMVLLSRERPREALESLQRAAAMAPVAPAILRGLGCVYHRLKDFPKAVEFFRQAATLRPDRADSQDELGHACFELGELEAAEAAFRRAAELNPQGAGTWNNLGKTLKQLNRLEEAIAAYGRAVAIRPDFVLAHYGLALALLAAGDLPAGFREYEWRPQRAPRTFPQPRWQGESLAGRTLFLHAEQGFGDAIQAVRLIPPLRVGGARVILECRPQLKRLFACSHCADEVIARDEPIPPFDCYASLLSVAFFSGLTLETIPSQAPYLASPPGRELPGGPQRIGLVWAGNPAHNEDAQRSLPLAELAPILKLPGRSFFSLQLSMPQRDRSVLGAYPNLVDLGRGFHDFLDTAAAVAQLDLVIAVDTAVAHLAGALGKPVWLLLAHSPDWRWFSRCGDGSPWYPTMRLFRQAQRNEWAPVIQRVAEALRGTDVATKRFFP
jgi:tetratricopeptide (TPR) repeat protein